MSRVFDMGGREDGEGGGRGAYVVICVQKNLLTHSYFNHIVLERKYEMELIVVGNGRQKNIAHC